MNLAGAVLLDPLSTRQNIEHEQQVDKELGMATACNEVLQRFDPRLELVLAKDNATSPHLMAGMWHIHRKNEGTVDSWIPITGPNGERVEPSIDLCMRELNKRDMWKHGVDAIYEAKKRQKQAEEKENEAKIDEACTDAGEVGAYVAKGIAGGRGKEWRRFT